MRTIFSALWLLAVFFSGVNPNYAQTPSGQSPTFNCTTPGCGAPTGGTFIDMGGNTICPQCFAKQYGEGNKVWYNGIGAWGPPGFTGGGNSGNIGGIAGAGVTPPGAHGTDPSCKRCHGGE